MAMNYEQRLGYLDRADIEFRRGNIAKALVDAMDKLNSGDCKLPQLKHSTIALYSYWLGCYKHVSGYPYTEVREAFACAALAYLKVFELRGTEEAFDARVATFDTRYPPGDPRALVEFKRVHPPGTKDHSVTNSRKNIQAVCLGLCAGEFALAERLASLAWDPPDTRDCTPNDQRIAYAMKDYFAGQGDAALERLKKAYPGQRRFLDVRYKANLIRALVTGDSDLFVVTCNEYLEWHERLARHPANRHEQNFYLCLPATGLSALAVHRGVVTLDRLNPDSPFLPVELVTLVQSGERGVENLSLRELCGNVVQSQA